MATLHQKHLLTNSVDLITRVRVVAVSEAMKPENAANPYFMHILANHNGGPWLDRLVRECVENPAILTKMVDEPEMHSPKSIDDDVLYILTTAGLLANHAAAYSTPQ